MSPNSTLAVVSILFAFHGPSLSAQDDAHVGLGLYGAEEFSIRLRFDPLPKWLSDRSIVPIERDRASQKLFHLRELVFLRHSQDVAEEIVAALDPSAVPTRNREELNQRYAILLEKQVRGWQTDKVRAEIRVELAKRDEREQRLRQRLGSIAQQLADLGRQAETPSFKKEMTTALHATGYVDVDGKVMLRDEAFPPFGIVR